MSVKFDFKTLETGFEASWPVKVNVPQDGGTVAVQEFDAVFRTLTQEEHTASQEADQHDGWLNAFLVGLVGETLTPELRKLMFGRPYVRQALINAYVQFCQGIAAKN